MGISNMAPYRMLLSLALLGGSFASSECGHTCSGHGKCVKSAQLLADAEDLESCTCDWGWQGTDCSVEMPGYLRIMGDQDALVIIMISFFSNFICGAIFIGGSIVMSCLISFYTNANLASLSSILSGGILSPASIPLLSYLVYAPNAMIHAFLFWRECLVQWRPALAWMSGSLPGMYMGLQVSSELDGYSFRFLVGCALCISVVCSSYGMYHQFQLDSQEAAGQQNEEGAPREEGPELFGLWPHHNCKSKARLVITLIVFGFLSGFMSGSTGVYGPVVIVLAASTGLTVHEMKAWLTTAGIFETVLCLVCSPVGIKSLDLRWLFFTAIVLLGLAGLMTGRLCQKYVDADRAARYIVFIVFGASVNYLSVVVMQDRTVQINLSCRALAFSALSMMLLSLGFMLWKAGQCPLNFTCGSSDRRSTE